MTTATKFATAKDVSCALRSLGLDAQTETIQTISRCCRDDFLERLSLCVTGQDSDGMGKRVISCLLTSLSTDHLERLRLLVPDISPEIIVPVALKTPARLLSAVDAASDPTHARHVDAKQYLMGVFSPFNASAQQGDPASQAEARQQDAVPPPAERHQSAPYSDYSGVEAPSTTPRQSAESKKFHSCHVYGSNYALCFNATEWEGKPGVMVDAATSTGPKSYDWKNAIHVWLDTNEVGAVLAVFRRWRKGIELAAHGAQNDKAFAIEFQGQHFYAKVTAKKAAQHPTRAVKILPTDATAVSVLFLTQLAQSYPAIPLNELLATVRATHQISDAKPD